MDYLGIAGVINSLALLIGVLVKNKMQDDRIAKLESDNVSTKRKLSRCEKARKKSPRKRIPSSPRRKGA